MSSLFKQLLTRHTRNAAGDAMSPMTDYYENLGDLNAAPPERSIFLYCDKCRVKWTGCQDQSECPRCGNTEAWRDHLAVDALIKDYL